MSTSTCARKYEYAVRVGMFEWKGLNFEPMHINFPMTNSKFLHDVDFNGILVDFLMSLNIGYSEISQLLFNNIHQNLLIHPKHYDKEYEVLEMVKN